tara:strand:+ start:916 stop:1104 length:189 start_codon:yes stop_codon:yes gene_type:complete
MASEVYGMEWLEPDKRLRLYRYMASIFKESDDFIYKDNLPPINRISRDAAHRAWNGYVWEIQ